MPVAELEHDAWYQAVAAIDAGDVQRLQFLIAAHPRLVTARLDGTPEWLRAAARRRGGWPLQPSLSAVVRHRRVALQEVRFAVEDATRGQDFEHRSVDTLSVRHLLSHRRRTRSSSWRSTVGKIRRDGRFDHRPKRCASRVRGLTNKRLHPTAAGALMSRRG